MVAMVAVVAVAIAGTASSGLCAEDRATRKRFAQDLRNLTLASPQVNRHRKSGKDAGEWIPDRNRCWFAARVVEVKQAYGLTVDPREAAALARILRGCPTTAMEPGVCRSEATSEKRTTRETDGGQHGIAPVPRSHPCPHRHRSVGTGTSHRRAPDRHARRKETVRMRTASRHRTPTR